MMSEGGSSSFPAERPASGSSTGADAADTATTASDSAKDAAGEVAAQAKVVAGEARRQIGTVVDETRQALSQQADDRTIQAAGGLRTLADQVSALADGRPHDAGPLAGYLGDAQSRVSAFAERLETGGPQGLLDDVTDFARRRPIVFLAAAMGAGFVVGRLARAGRAAQQDDAAAPTSRVTPGAVPTDELPPPAPMLDAPVGTAVSGRP